MATGWMPVRRDAELAGLSPGWASRRPTESTQMAKNQSEWRCGVLVRFLADEAEMADWEGYEHSNMEELVSIRVEPSGWCHVHRSRTKYFEYPCAPNEDVVVQLEMSVTDPACPASGFRPGRSGAGGARAPCARAWRPSTLSWIRSAGCSACWNPPMDDEFLPSPFGGADGPPPTLIGDADGAVPDPIAEWTVTVRGAHGRLLATGGGRARCDAAPLDAPPERGSSFQQLFGACRRRTPSGLLGSQGDIRKVSARRGSSAFAVGMLRDAPKKLRSERNARGVRWPQAAPRQRGRPRQVGRAAGRCRARALHRAAAGISPR